MELLLRDGNLEPVPKNEAYEVPSVIDPAASSVAPLASVKDVHLTLGIFLGSEPSSVKIVMWVVNQSRPQRLINTNLVAILPTNRHKCDEVAGMVNENLAQHEREHEGVVVGGVRRAGRFLLSRYGEALCTVHGHKGPSAEMPCMSCLSLKAPSATHAALEEDFGTI